MVKRIAFVGVVFLFLVGSFARPSVAQDDWKFGIGTGFFALNMSGDIGFDTALGPVIVEADLDTSDISDALESAIGIGGFAAKGKWQFNFSFATMELEAGVSGTGLMGVPVAALLNFEATVVDLGASYRFAVTGKHAWNVLFGGRFIQHEYNVGLTVGATALARTIDNDYTDAIVGIAHAYPFSEKVAWTNHIDVGIGDSESQFKVNSGIAWQVAKPVLLNFYAQIQSLDLQTGSPGSSDFYLYDADEFGVGVGILFTF